MGDFAARYRDLSDEQIMELYIDRAQLAPEAHEAVLVEFRARQLGGEDALAVKRAMIQERREIERKQSLFGKFLFGALFSGSRPRNKT